MIPKSKSWGYITKQYDCIYSHLKLSHQVLPYLIYKTYHTFYWSLTLLDNWLPNPRHTFYNNYLNIQLLVITHICLGSPKAYHFNGLTPKNVILWVMINWAIELLDFDEAHQSHVACVDLSSGHSIRLMVITCAYYLFLDNIAKVSTSASISKFVCINVSSHFALPTLPW